MSPWEVLAANRKGGCAFSTEMEPKAYWSTLGPGSRKKRCTPPESSEGSFHGDVDPGLEDSAAILPGLGHDVVGPRTHSKRCIYRGTADRILEHVIHINLHGVDVASCGNAGLNGHRRRDR